MLRVSFDKQCIIRILDEFPLSTEEDDTPNERLASEHFAFASKGLLSPAFRPVLGRGERACNPLSVRHRVGLSRRSHGCYSVVHRRAGG